MTLTTTIANLLLKAQHKPDTIVEIRLKRGLVLGLKMQPGDNSHD
jgi:hypothetical protein